MRVLSLMRHARVPLPLKLGTLLAALVILSPLDLFGDVPGLGLLDDAMLLTLLAVLFVQVANWTLARGVVLRGAPPARGRGALARRLG